MLAQGQYPIFTRVDEFRINVGGNPSLDGK